MASDELKIEGETVVLNLKRTHQDEPNNKDFESVMVLLQLEMYDFYYDEINQFQELVYCTEDKENVIRLFVNEKTLKRWIEINGVERDTFASKLSSSLEIGANEVPKTEKSTKFTLFDVSTWFKK